MTTLAAWFHTLDPVVVRLWGDLAIRWYGLSYVTGFVVAYLIMRALAKRDLIAIPAHRVGDALLWFVGGVLLGGRLGYALFYDEHFRLLTGFHAHFPFWSFLEINKGGMASHGGMVGVIVAGWIVSRGFKETDPATGRTVVVGRCDPRHVFDVLALVCPVGLGLGRVANFVNGELLGKIAAPAGTEGPWWSVQYPQELEWFLVDPASGATSPDPSRLVQTPEQWGRIVALAREAAPRAATEADAVHGLIARAPQYVERLRPLVSARHASQLYQAAAEGLVLGAVLWLVWMKPRKPGVIGSLFLLVYGVLRILTELIRLPDANLEHQRILGLSRGQWLSVVMVGVGATMVVVCSRRAVRAIGGWRWPARVGGGAGAV
jgi:phosphatidylglycerol:prolipoprotein diacylglycerol transferase